MSPERKSLMPRPFVAQKMLAQAVTRCQGRSCFILWLSVCGAGEQECVRAVLEEDRAWRGYGPMHEALSGRDFGRNAPPVSQQVSGNAIAGSPSKMTYSSKIFDFMTS